MTLAPSHAPRASSATATRGQERAVLEHYLLADHLLFLVSIITSQGMYLNLARHLYVHIATSLSYYAPAKLARYCPLSLTPAYFWWGRCGDPPTLHYDIEPRLLRTKFSIRLSLNEVPPLNCHLTTTTIISAIVVDDCTSYLLEERLHPEN